MIGKGVINTVGTAGKIAGGIAGGIGNGVKNTIGTAGRIVGGIGNGVLNTIGTAGRIAGNAVDTGLKVAGNAAKAGAKKVLMEVKQEKLQELINCLNNTATGEDSIQKSGETDCKIIYTAKSDEMETQQDSTTESISETASA